MVESEKIKKQPKPKGKQAAIKLPKNFGVGPRHKARAQVAALCFRQIKSKHEILLITSRDSGRWVLPKGWPIDGLDLAGAAAQEAWEEAGVRGTVQGRCVGLFEYDKVLETGTDLPVRVAVFPLEVSGLAEDFPEKGQRKLKWFSPKKAAGRVNEPGLKKILRKFEAKNLR